MTTTLTILLAIYGFANGFITSMYLSDTTDKTYIRVLFAIWLALTGCIIPIGMWIISPAYIFLSAQDFKSWWYYLFTKRFDHLSYEQRIRVQKELKTIQSECNSTWKTILTYSKRTLYAKVLNRNAK